jgi:hypothetical protein
MRSLCLICVEAPSARRIFGKARMDRDCDLWGAESHEQCPHFARDEIRWGDAQR